MGLEQEDLAVATSTKVSRWDFTGATCTELSCSWNFTKRGHVSMVKEGRFIFTTTTTICSNSTQPRWTNACRVTRTTGNGAN